MMEFDALQALMAGGNALGVVVVAMLWRMDRRLVLLEYQMKGLCDGKGQDGQGPLYQGLEGGKGRRSQGRA